MARPEPAPELQTQVGKLQLREILSSSFFGARHRARSANNGRSGTHALGTAARQTVPPTFDSELRAALLICVDAPDVIERLALAATAARAAVHPALFTPLEIAREPARLGISTIDLPGVTLAQLVERAAAREEGLPQAIVLRIVLDLLAGLHALEAAMTETVSDECLYGGLTPDSIHVGRDGQTRVLDPGVMAAAARQSVWADDRRMLAYSAPEQHAPNARYSARIDTFAIGTVLWELLSCRTLFLAPSARETIEAVCSARVARVRRERFVRGEPITVAVANVIVRALEREPLRRFQSYGELAVALRDAAPVAEAEQVAAFVAEMDPPECVPAFVEREHDTAKVQLERADETGEVLVELAEPIAAHPRAVVAGPVDVTTAPAPWRHEAWAIGMAVLVAVAAFALLSPGGLAGSKVPPEQRARNVQPTDEPETRARPPQLTQPTSAEPPMLPAAAEPMPTASAESPLLPAQESVPIASVPTESQLKANTPARKKAAKMRKAQAMRRKAPKPPSLPKNL